MSKSKNSQRTVAVATACACIVSLSAAAGARAQDPAAGGLHAPWRQSGQCSADTVERLDYIEQRLEAGRRHAAFWWRGFTGGYGLGTVITSVQAGVTDNSGDRAVSIVSAVKALFGTTRLLLVPLEARLGADPMYAMPAASAEDCQRVLARGEELLEQSAKDARSRRSWKRHAFNVGLNAAGAVVAGEGFDDREDAWISAGVGIFVGTMMAWTQPSRGESDLEDYQRRFPAKVSAAGPKITWRITPFLAGARISANF